MAGSNMFWVYVFPTFALSMFTRRIANDLSLHLGLAEAVTDAKGKGESRVFGLFYPCLFSLMTKDLRNDRGGLVPSR